MKEDKIENQDLKRLVEELEAAKKQIVRQELKIEVLASQILQLRADQLLIGTVQARG